MSTVASLRPRAARVSSFVRSIAPSEVVPAGSSRAPRRPGVKASWVATVAGLVGALGCSVDPVNVTDVCEPLGEAVWLHEPPVFGTERRSFSIGLVDGQVLLSIVALADPRDRGRFTARGQWFDERLAPVTGEIWLGDGSYLPVPRWTAFQHRVWGQLWAVPDPSGPLPPMRQQVAIYALTPGSPAFERTPRDLPIISNYDGTDTIAFSIGASFATAGREARAAAAVGYGRPVFALNGIPSAPVSCASFPYSCADRVMVFDSGSVYVHQYGTNPCSSMPVTPSQRAHEETLVALRDGGLGIFYRMGDGIGDAALHYSRLGPDLRVIDQPPYRVGAHDLSDLLPGGFQARAVALDSGMVLFTERSLPNSGNYGYFTCSDLFLVPGTGGGSGRAPWQLPCRPPPDSYTDPRIAPTVTQYIALEPLANGHAAMAYGERTNFAAPLTFNGWAGGPDWQEGVFLQTMDGQGRRASDRMRVTPAGSTATWGDATIRAAGDYQVEAATEGDVVVVVWRDTRLDAPGYYGRRYRCTTRPE